MGTPSHRVRLRGLLQDHPRTLARARRLHEVARPLALLEAQSQGRERLVESPVFALCSIRSGSTLLRSLLNAHSQIRAPHELHLNAVRVTATGMGRTAMGELGLDDERLQYLLWDRVLHRELLGSGKQIIVDKTPFNALIWRRLVRCWPQARFLVLRRHPGAITDSWHRAHPDLTRDEVAEVVQRYLPGMTDAYAEHGGLIVRYEDLTRDPAAELTRICEFLGVEFEPTMLTYGSGGERWRRGLGDWSDKIRSGLVQPSGPLPDAADIPDALVPVSRAWGYL